MDEQGTDWEAKARGLVKGELKKRNVTYKQLVERLAEMGIKENEANITNKLHRGKFTAVFMLQVLGAVGCTDLRLSG